MIGILAHRGYWLTKDEQNSIAAIERAFENGFGVETDVRDCDGELMISHDMPRKNGLTMSALVDIWKRYDCKPRLALNIKADGMANSIARHLSGLPERNWFAFDMSIPDALTYDRLGLPFLSRRSEFEPASPLERRAVGIWMDCFTNACVDQASMCSAAAETSMLCIVSPELHGRPHKPGWTELQAFLEMEGSPRPALLLCTDFPEQAAKRFR